MKESKIRAFSAKSKTIDGVPAKLEVYVNDTEQALLMVKYIVHKEDLTKRGYQLVRAFTWGSLYKQELTLKKTSLAAVVKEVFK